MGGVAGGGCMRTYKVIAETAVLGVVEEVDASGGAGCGTGELFIDEVVDTGGATTSSFGAGTRGDLGLREGEY